MKTPENIEIFDLICLILFDKLYLAFPIPIEIDMDALVIKEIPLETSHEKSWDILSVGNEVVNFLAEEGFLSVKGSSANGSQYHQVRLTMKGLAVLGYVPMSVVKQEPLISKIRSLVGMGLKEAGSETLRQLVSQVFGLALAAAPASDALIGKQ